MRTILTYGDIKDVKDEFGRLGIDPTCLYYGHWSYDMIGCWEISDEDYAILHADTNTKEGWQTCGWRYAEGSNLGSVNKRFNVNHHYLNGWDNGREQDGIFKSNYSKLYDYLCEHIGVSTERNVAAALVDLAAQNEMSIADLLNRYQCPNLFRYHLHLLD